MSSRDHQNPKAGFFMRTWILLATNCKSSQILNTQITYLSPDCETRYNFVVFFFLFFKFPSNSRLNFHVSSCTNNTNWKTPNFPITYLNAPARVVCNFTDTHTLLCIFLWECVKQRPNRNIYLCFQCVHMRVCLCCMIASFMPRIVLWI